jgi:hypothetical protein
MEDTLLSGKTQLCTAGLGSSQRLCVTQPYGQQNEVCGDRADVGMPRGTDALPSPHACKFLVTWLGRRAVHGGEAAPHEYDDATHAACPVATCCRICPRSTNLDQACFDANPLVRYAVQIITTL